MNHDEVSPRVARLLEAQALCSEVGRSPDDVSNLMWALVQLDERDDNNPA